MMEDLGYLLVMGGPGILFAFSCYAVIAVSAVLAWRRLRRNLKDPIGLVCVAVILGFPVYIGAEYGYDKIAVAERAREVRDWPRIAAPQPLPRALIFIAELAGNDEPPDYVLNAAESGLFDVYFKDRSTGEAFKAELTNSSDCAKRRTTDNRFVVMMGFTRCAGLIATSVLPDEAIVVHAGQFFDARTPYSIKPTDNPFNLGSRTAWAVEVALRHGENEALIDYREYIRKSKLFVHPLFGVRLTLEDEATQRLSMGSWQTPSADVNGTLYPALHIDLAKVAPPTDISNEKLDQKIARLGDAAEEASTQALARLAAANPGNRAIGQALRRSMANPALGEALWIHPADCDYSNALASYRDDIAIGCAANPKRLYQNCGMSISEVDWIGMCTSGQPIWRGDSAETTRVLVTETYSNRFSNVSLARSWVHATSGLPIVEVSVPADRGMIDLAVLDEGSEIWHFSGAVTCLSQIAMLSTNAMISGAPKEGVRYAYRFPVSAFRSNWMELVGEKPDILVKGGQTSRVDLAAYIPPAPAAKSCPPGAPVPPLTETAGPSVVVKIDSLVTPPFLLPVDTSVPDQP